jgi:SulP family sulfate permease
MSSRGAARRAGPSFVELYMPKLVTVLREGYGLADLRVDALAGLNVAVVAVPLSLAIAIASGATPAAGLATAIIGGFLISALGGSRYQIGGPAGAFIVVVAEAMHRLGPGGVALAVVVAGLMLIAAALLRLGTFVKYMPYPVTVGFTAGIAVTIFASQIKELLGLTLAGAEPGPIVPKLVALAAAMPSISPPTVGLAAITLAAILAVRRLAPRLPSYLIAVAIAAFLVWVFDPAVATIGTRYGGIPQALPAFTPPRLDLATLRAVLPTSATFALLGSIESLLSAVVADSMTGRRHRSNAELVGQGVANIACGLFGGIAATGVIVRTATNIRLGARSPFAGMFHALYLAAFVLLAAPLARDVPLASLAAILGFVCWDMVEKNAIATLVRASWGDAAVLAITFLIVVFDNLSAGIIVGFGLATLLFMHRMATEVGVDQPFPQVGEDVADDTSRVGTEPFVQGLAADPDIAVYRISGAFFFGAAAAVASALDRMGSHPRAYVLDFAAVPLIDATAAETIAGMARKAHRAGARVIIARARPGVRRTLLLHGVRPPTVRFRTGFEEALAAARGAEIHEPAAQEAAPALPVS